MDEETFEGDKDATEEQMVESGGLDSSEEGFLKGYSEDEDVDECAECGSACPEDKKVVKEFDGESYSFCSKQCAKEFEESLGESS
ncbi:hypothetical protein HYT52_04800 [Candidatus Woesearchaeota archaeon]|nr:hypothetical protein [Candidatus Woesearchaeota archaeon]